MTGGLAAEHGPPAPATVGAPTPADLAPDLATEHDNGLPAACAALFGHPPAFTHFVFHIPTPAGSLAAAATVCDGRFTAASLPARAAATAAAAPGALPPGTWGAGLASMIWRAAVATRLWAATTALAPSSPAQAAT